MQRIKVLLVCLLTVSQLTAQNKMVADKVLPVSPYVKIGKLSNGLTYYIRKNQEPKNRAELRLVVNAGSTLESDKQVGLAHFVEHMCFNGTKNFKKQELVD
ncbi:insulinase family protein, partial [Erythrobacter sp. YJ-T3-07]|uniref:insulinase family protein n=1 Tax=Erythrobacter sp. YJ-T3-07 TaxID=2793063 RepID=UPI0018D371D5